MTIDDEPYFVASDICKVLEISNTTQAVQRLDDDEKSMLNIGLVKIQRLVRKITFLPI